jgi:hypothetical protein
MTPADKRVQELLDRWLASIELHAQYLKLDDAAYARVENWPRHQRPTKWVIELARTRLLELQANLARHTGEASFAESLELMAFLTSLLGSEHIERFIPLATGKPADAPADAPAAKTVAQRLSRSDGAAGRNPATMRPSATAPAQSSPAPATPAPAAKPSVPASPAEQKAIKTVIADAVRFLEWGREWPALASQIARLADRPTEAEVRSILRLYKDEITRRSKRPLD